MIFYGVYLIPISAIKEKIDKIPTNNFQGENTKDSEDKKIQVENKEDYKNDVISKINTVITEKEYNNNKITEMDVNKENQISAKNNGIIERTKKGEQEEKTYEIYSTKICTLCGYIYIRKESVKKSQCICYYYTSKCNWFSDMVCNINIIVCKFFKPTSNCTAIKSTTHSVNNSIPMFSRILHSSFTTLFK